MKKEGSIVLIKRVERCFILGLAACHVTKQHDSGIADNTVKIAFISTWVWLLATSFLTIS